ncbi:hypothetical protein B0H13DRAFT_1932772 [Mycena leptocephala]|nr:hypothetical protein B0H13DRAFT_1932772 [Mycena leptocephala]
MRTQPNLGETHDQDQRSWSTRRPEKSELRPNPDSSGLDAVKAKARRKKLRTTRRQMLPRRPRSSAPASADSRMHRRIESSSQSSSGPHSSPVEIKAKMTLEDHVKPVKMNTPTGSRAP